MTDVSTVDLRGLFLPKNGDEALHDVKERLYSLLADVEAVQNEDELGWVAFRIMNILDIIERS